MSEPTRLGYVVTSYPEGADWDDFERDPAVSATSAYQHWHNDRHPDYVIREVLEVPGEERIIARAEGEEVPEGAVKIEHFAIVALTGNRDGGALGEYDIDLKGITFYRLTTAPRRVLGRII